MRWLVTCSYDGRDFEGWQRQPHARTVQGTIEEVFSQLFDQPIQIHSVSRTDAKVHALRQDFHVDIPKKRTMQVVKTSLNRMLPKDIHIVRIKKVTDDFHVRKRHSTKQYEYRIHLKPSPFLIHYSLYYYLPLNRSKLMEASRLFEGTKNFQNFTVKPEDTLDFVRTLQPIVIQGTKYHLRLRFNGSGFMTHMVRMIVGTLLAYNENKITLEEIQALLTSSKRLPVSFKAPAHGLYLMGITYEK